MILPRCALLACSATWPRGAPCWPGPDVEDFRKNPLESITPRTVSAGQERRNPRLGTQRQDGHSAGPHSCPRGHAARHLCGRLLLGPRTPDAARSWRCCHQCWLHGGASLICCSVPAHGQVHHLQAIPIWKPNEDPLSQVSWRVTCPV